MRFKEKNYDLPITRDYVKSWGLLEAVRELIQNALDTESPMQWFYEDGELSIISDGSRLGPKTLLLGGGTKAHDPETIGSFGEGYKLAMLVLLRCGHEPKIINNEFIWTPCFADSEVYGAEILRIVQTPNPKPLGRLEFVVNGVTEEDFEKIRASCLQMYDTIGNIKQTSKGLILMDMPGKLFVGGLFICKTCLCYGYDLKPEYITLERDRQTVDDWDLKHLTRDMWVEAEDYETLARLMEDGIDDVDYVKFTNETSIDNACYRRFKSEHPDHILVNSQFELEENIKAGKKVVFAKSECYHRAVTQSAGYKAEVRHVKISPLDPTQIIEAWRDKYKKHMRRAARDGVQELIDDSKYWSRQWLQVR